MRDYLLVSAGCNGRPSCPTGALTYRLPVETMKAESEHCIALDRTRNTLTLGYVMISRCTLLFCLTCFASMPNAASALESVHLDGHVGSTALGADDCGFGIGQEAHVAFTYDETTPDENPDDYVGRFPEAVTGVSLEVDNNLLLDFVPLIETNVIQVRSEPSIVEHRPTQFEGQLILGTGCSRTRRRR